jgi:alkyl sulfatase BDS1-like metallo-beta-lactamase superfamily hydrolase
MLFDALGVRLKDPKSDGKSLTFNLDFTELKKQHTVTLENSVLNYTADKKIDNADASFTLTRPVLDEVLMGAATLQDKLASGEVKVEGDSGKLGELMVLLDDFEFWFNVVTP